MGLGITKKAGPIGGKIEVLCGNLWVSSFLVPLSIYLTRSNLKEDTLRGLTVDQDSEGMAVGA